MKPTCKLSVNRNADENSTMYVNQAPDQTHVGFIRPIKNNYLRMKFFYIIIGIICLFSAASFAQPTSNALADYYNGDEGYPLWTDQIKWNNVINMSLYSNGANDFEKFENARDVLYGQGGGVLYYPAGIYTFSNIPLGPNGRGLMLKKGVVIRGQAPTADKEAIPNDYIRYRTNGERALTTKSQRENHGLDSLKTIFRFPYAKVKDANNVDKDVPEMWNIIGLMPVSVNGERLSDVSLVGIAWVKLEGAAIFMGPDLSDYNTLSWGAIGSWLGSKTKNGTGTKYWGDQNWKDRIADGTHYLDPFCGSASNNKTYVPGAKGRFIFGCWLENSTLNGSVIDHSNTANQDFLDGGHRFGSRITMYGANIFIANNVISKPSKSFKFVQNTIDRSTVAPPVGTIAPHTLLFNYAYSIGIDVNKQLGSQPINRSNLTTGNYYEEGVIVRDNWVYQFGNKAYEIAGRFVTLQNNITYRDYFVENSDAFGLDIEYASNLGWRMALNSWSEVKLSDDLMTRGFDIGGQYFWIDRNWYDGCGSLAANGAEQPNDGEGILVQRHGAVDAMSFALTRNVQGPVGHQGGMTVYDAHAVGYFSAWNFVQQNTSNVYGVGIQSVKENYIADNTVYANMLWSNSSSDSIILDDCGIAQMNCAIFNGTNNVKDFLYICPVGAVKSPISVDLSFDEIAKCFLLKWQADPTDHQELGFRIDRKINSSDWHTISYRPRHEWTDSFAYNGADNSGVLSGFGAVIPIDMNRQVWKDYTAPFGASLQYRVISLDCNEDTIAALKTTKLIVACADLNADITLAVYPNPAVDQLNIISSKNIYQIELFNSPGQSVLLSRNNFRNAANISIAPLKPGLYILKITLEDGIIMNKKVVVK